MTGNRVISFVATVIPPLAVLFFIVAEHAGWIDHWRGIDLVQQVADRFNLSYALGASRPVYPTDPEWNSTITLIRKHAKTKLRADKLPQTIARMRATLSTDEAFAETEWTAPSTPIVVLYRQWPNPGNWPFTQDEFSVVGTIGDLQNWIDQSKADFHFLVDDVLLGVMTVLLSVWAWRLDREVSNAAQPLAASPTSVTVPTGGIAPPPSHS